MSRLEERLREDRALRDAARRNVLADIEHVKENLSGARIASRLVGRVGDGAVDVFERAKEQAEDKRGVLAALIGALLVWIAREPLFEMLGLAGEAENDGGADADTAAPARPAETDAGENEPTSGDNDDD